MTDGPMSPKKGQAERDLHAERLGRMLFKARPPTQDLLHRLKGFKRKNPKNLYEYLHNDIAKGQSWSTLRRMEYQVAKEAAAGPIRELREEWLKQLILWRDALHDEPENEDVICLLGDDIKRLRRQLGYKVPTKEKRAQNRERVRRHRLSKKRG